MITANWFKQLYPHASHSKSASIQVAVATRREDQNWTDNFYTFKSLESTYMVEHLEVEKGQSGVPFGEIVDRKLLASCGAL